MTQSDNLQSSKAEIFSELVTSMKLPNIRNFFVPDPGYIMVEADLEGADAQVVAWEAEDEDLKNAFRK